MGIDLATRGIPLSLSENGWLHQLELSLYLTFFSSEHCLNNNYNTKKKDVEMNSVSSDIIQFLTVRERYPNFDVYFNHF